ncbi:MAG: peptide deformylase [Candidatus Omnitrophota bacterium]
MLTMQINLRIRYYGDPCLRKKCKVVARVTDRERAILKEMREVMCTSGGIGLAAPQVGLDKQMLIVDVGEGLVSLINPKLEKKSGAEFWEEGCLSLPGINVKVKRAKKIEVSGLDENGHKVNITAYDLFACALQHEMDHLKGKLIIDYASLFQKMKFKKRLKSLRGGRCGLPKSETQ